MTGWPLLVALMLLVACGGGGAESTQPVSPVPGGTGTGAQSTPAPVTPVATPPATDASAPALAYQGVNLAGAEFGGGTLPGVYGKDYIYPSQTEVDYYLAKGMNVIRLPFRWERLQPALGGELDNAERLRLDGFIASTTGKGLSVILDPHNYARWRGNLVGGATVSNASFADFWGRLAAHYKNNPNVIFGLMNEPHDMPTEQWLNAANAAIAAIRNAGAMQLILVPGNAWTGAHSWASSGYGTPNATALKNIVDPGNHYAIEVHQYLDADYSGTSPNCQSATIGSKKLAVFTAWLKANNQKGFLGEVAGGANDTCYAALDDMFSYMEANADVWIGWTWWAGGPWWGDYMFTLDPKNGADRPQWPVVSRHIPPRG